MTAADDADPRAFLYELQGDENPFATQQGKATLEALLAILSPKPAQQEVF